MIGQFFDTMIVAHQLIVVYRMTHQNLSLVEFCKHVASHLKRQHFMTYDVTTVKGFQLLPEVSLSFLSQGEFSFAGRPRILKRCAKCKSNDILSCLEVFEPLTHWLSEF